MGGPGKDFIDDQEMAMVLKVLESKQLNRYRFDDENVNERSMVSRFESDFSGYIGAHHTIGTNSCTSALMAVLKALSIGHGDEVIVPCYTFIATVAAIVHVGASPVFCNIDESLAISIDDVKQAYSTRTKAIICVHMLGRPGPMDALIEFTRHNNLFLIEDVAQACGGSYKGQKLGSFGIAGVFSFNIFKMITAGDGGAVVTSDEDLYAKAFAFHDHGFFPKKDRIVDSGHLLGMNLRMTELAGAVLIVQLKKINEIISSIAVRRKKLVEMFKLPDFVKISESHDPAGETGTSLVLKFESAHLAQNFCTLLHTKTLVDSGRHFYKNMIEVNSSWSQRTDLNRSTDILNRSVVIGIGVLDHYLASGLGVSALCDEKEIVVLSESINRVLKFA